VTAVQDEDTQITNADLDTELEFTFNEIDKLEQCGVNAADI
jgi:hypothetical protein